MSDGVLIRLVPLTPTMLSGSTTTFAPANLADPQPKVVWQTVPAAGAFGASITVDLGADTAFDTVALLYGNASPAATWELFARTAADGPANLGNGTDRIFGTVATTPMRLPPTTRATRFHALARGASITRRHLKIGVADTALNPDGFLNAGVLAIGQTWATGFGFEFGSGRKLEDQSVRRILDGGEIASWRKAKVPLFRATWSNFTEAEQLVLWSIMSEVGETEPLLLIEDPDSARPGLAERLHYGVFETLDFYERSQADKSRIEMKIRDWL